MGVEKLSVSFDTELAAVVREAAAERGVGVSAWLAEAAQARVRQRALRDALDAAAAEDRPLAPSDIDRLVTQARRTSRVVSGTGEKG